MRDSQRHQASTRLRYLLGGKLWAPYRELLCKVPYIYKLVSKELLLTSLPCPVPTGQEPTANHLQAISPHVQVRVISTVHELPYVPMWR